MVCHCYRNGGNVTRIISARKATPYERNIYENGGYVMKNNYELKGPRLKSDYPERIKKYGYSVNINYETAEDAKKAIASGSLNELLENPQLKTISLTIKANGGEANMGIGLYD